MKTSTKTRIAFSICIITAALAAYLAINYNGLFVPIAFIIAPLMLLLPIVITGSYICPKCKNGVYSSSGGAAEQNPYYIVLLSGKCAHCGEGI